MDESKNNNSTKDTPDEHDDTTLNDSAKIVTSQSAPTVSELEEVTPSIEQNLLHSSLVVSSDGIKTEEDLDLNAPPTEFKSSEEEVPPPKAEDLRREISSIMKGDPKSAEAVKPVNLPKPKPVVMRASLWEKIKQPFYAWWVNRPIRYVTIILFIVVLAVATLVSIVRTTVLNAVGVRSTLTVTVFDETTLMPLKNVVLRADNVQVKTDTKGYAKLYDVRLGKQTVLVEKPGFKKYKKTVDFGLRTENLGEVMLKAEGIQFTFLLTDYLSGKPVKDVDVSSGEATTKSDKSGKAILTVPPMNDSEEVEIKLTQKGYRSETVTLPASFAGVKEVKMVVGQRAVFINKESGKFDVYKMYVDGTKKERLLAGTGLESAAIQVLPDPEGKYAALVSTRDDKRNKDGYLLTTLTLVDVDNGDTDTIEHAEQITLLGWRGTSLVYSQTVAGASAANSSRQKVIAYDYSSSKRNLLATANYFNNTILAGDSLYYVISATDPNAKSGLFKVGDDGTEKKQIYDGYIWSFIRTDYQTAKIQTPTKWYEYKLGTAAAVSANPSSSYATKQFVDSPDGKSSAWIDQRDSKGVLLRYDIASAKDAEIVTERGLSEVAYWLGQNTVVFHTFSNNMLNEYAVSLDGGEAKHISEVSSSYQH